jgi:hypothetical protein
MSIVEVESSAKDEAAKTHALACFMKPQLQLTRTTKMQTQRLSKVDMEYYANILGNLLFSSTNPFRFSESPKL